MQKEAIVASLRTTPVIFWRGKGKPRNPSDGRVSITAREFNSALATESTYAVKHVPEYGEQPLNVFLVA
jgi:hypothetical protein